MKRVLLVPVLVLVPLLIQGCASNRRASPEVSSADAQQISPAHPYCMYVQKAGQLRECYQFAFGRCTAFGPRCDTPGFMASAESNRDAGASGAGGSTP